MKIECIKEKLENAVAKVARFVGRNESLPILVCILLEVKGDKLTLRATNLDLGIELHLSVKSSKDGQCAVPGNVLRSLLSSMRNEKKISLETSHENLLVSTPQNTSLVKSQKTDDFPTIPKINGNEVFSLSASVLKQGFESVGYSASTSFVKPELASVYLYKDGEDLIFVATDSFRLAEKRISLKKQINFTSAIIPHKNLVEIIHVLEESRDEVKINTNKNQISFESDNTYLTSRLVDGVFPDYKQIIPKKSETEVIVLKEDLIQALKTTNVFSDKFFKVLFKVSADKKKFEIEARNADIGENTTQVDAKIEGNDISVAFNHHYILDVLQVIKDDSVVLQFGGPGKALVIQGVEDNSLTYLVMPMNH